MKDGTVRFNPGFLNPDVVRPVGPIDPEVPVLLLRTVEGRPLGGVVNFALHACTVLKPGISADYPHFLEETLRKQLGDQFVCIYAAGTCGDVNHFDINRIRPDGVQVNRGQTMLSDYVPRPSNQRSPLTYQYIGESLGKTVAAELPKLNPVAKPSLAVRRAMLSAPLATFSEMDLEWAKNVDRRKVSFLQGVRAGRILSLAEMRKSGDTTSVEVQAIRLGDDTALVAMPGEMFVELGLAIKRASPFRNTLVVELSGSGHINYVPTRRAFVEGDYEVVNSRLESGGGELMADAAIRLLKDLKAELR
jgi:hypothetical protein